ncbi:MAG: hypothetical protein JWO63_2799 [Frankiales bacterium]|jgi:hypothetical protein|nr:hypothetical protein [Frankiales bacterium]
MTMTLSERERQLLQEMESELGIPDPQAARAGRRLHPWRLLRVVPRPAMRAVAAIGGLLGGLLLLIVGVSQGGTWGTVVGVAASALVIVSIDRGVTYLRARRGRAA